MNKLAQSTTINVKNKILDLRNPQIMGIINLTPDSFFDGGHYNSHELALERASRLLKEGASVLDVGAYSSRPGADVVCEKDEMERMVPFIEKLVRKHPEVIISVDTFRASVAARAIEAGASIVNDVSGGSLDPQMFETVGRLKVPYVLMHMRGTPETMQDLTDYEDIVADMMAYFIERISQLRSCGVKDIILDLGFGFAKTSAQNYHILNRFNEFSILGLPLLGALSRKTMIYKTLGVTPKEALNGTTVLNTLLVMKGAAMIRVHDVAEAKEVAILLDTLNKNA